MNAITFDTHGFVKRLTAAGMPEAQAEVLADEQTNLIENNLATKRDLGDLEVALKRDLKELELRLVHTLTIRFGGMLVTGIVVMAALVKLL